MLHKITYSRRILQVKLFIAVLISLAHSSAGQTVIAKDSAVLPGSTVVYPGKEYQRSGYHNFFAGKHYRDEWSTAVRAPNFYLDTAKGGLTVVKEGGSRQSNGLRLKNPAGKEYVLRSIDKDFGNGLPDIYHGTFIARIAKDQASIGYPYAAITITPMIEAAGLLHTNPEIVFVPQQPALGEFNEKYANQLYLLEERPDDDQQDVYSFGYSKKVIGSDKLFEKVYASNNNQVDQTAFAKARLFDMFIGDWGRHADQWRWASFEQGEQTIYRAIPRDRDQAYTKFDGFYPFIATHIIGGTQLESFSNNIHNIGDFNKPGQPLDKKFTNELTEEQWIEIAKSLQSSLTDNVIENGMHQLPPQLFAIHGETIIAKLKSRRDHLQDFAKSYYKFLAKHISIFGSNDKELFEINRISDQQTAIRIYRINEQNSPAATPYYNRVFNTNETKEIRMYGFKDKDIFKVTGQSSEGVKIRVIGMTKQDSIVHDLANWDHKTKFYKGKKGEYDTVYQSRFHIAPVIFTTPPCHEYFEENSIDLFTRTGLKLGVNLEYHLRPWERDSMEYRQLLTFNYGLQTKAFTIEYAGIYPHVIGSLDFVIRARYDNPAIENYFGTGNETQRSNKLDYYRSMSTRFYGGIGVAKDFALYHHAEVYGLFQHIDMKNQAGHYVNEVVTENLPFGAQNFAGVEGGYHFRKTNNDLYPSKGIDFSLGMGYIKNLTHTDRSFYKINSSLAFYIPLFKSITLAIRGGGGTVSGEADYFHLQELGRTTSLRGYARERFYGHSSFYNNNELRWLTNTHNFVFNGKIGLLAFLDNGRVWEPGEKSNKWHMGYGGGIVIIPFNRIVLNGSYGISEESSQIMLRLGYFF